METINVNTIDFLVNTEICKSKREARELLKAGAIRINCVQIKDKNFNLKMGTKDKHKRKQ